MILTLEQARAMSWPFHSPRQPIGVLLDQGTLTVHDLQHACRIAYSPRFKAACLLLLHELRSQANTPTLSITRSEPRLDHFPAPPLPSACPICASRLQVQGSVWECASDHTHYWQHRVNRLRAARQQWLDGLPLEERPYRAEIWQTACDAQAREQFLNDHALPYPAGS